MSTDLRSAWMLARERFTPSRIAPRAPDEVAFRLGSRPVLATAVHATPQMRDGVLKPAESESGALAEALGKTVGYSFLTVIGPQTGDANWDPDNPIRDQIASRLERHRVMLDFHMMLDSHGPHICLGLGPLPDAATGRFAALAAHEAELCQLECSVNWPFRADPCTVTAFAQKHSVSAIQIELATRVQHVHMESIRSGQLIRWLTRLDKHIRFIWG